MVQVETTNRGTRRTRAAIMRPRPLHEEVVDRLRDMILEGEIKVGERLHEHNLAETLQVSRTPIREAVKLLATEGLVDLLPGRGARVAALSAEMLQQVIEVIAGLERHAAELAAARMSPQEFERLQRMHERMRAHHRAGDRRAYFRLNHDIHLGVVAAARNPALAQTHALLIARARRGRHTALESQERWIEAMAEHELLMAALAARDGRRAGEILLQHDLRTAAVVRAMLSGAAPGDAPG
jgi:DNA-binding GntR family transcriptional regulator